MTAPFDMLVYELEDSIRSKLLGTDINGDPGCFSSTYQITYKCTQFPVVSKLELRCFVLCANIAGGFSGVASENVTDERLIAQPLFLTQHFQLLNKFILHPHSHCKPRASCISLVLWRDTGRTCCSEAPR